MNKQLENRISSLLRKIDDINEDFRESKIGFSKYWIESSYKVNNSKLDTGENPHISQSKNRL